MRAQKLFAYLALAIFLPIWLMYFSENDSKKTDITINEFSLSNKNVDETDNKKIETLLDTLVAIARRKTDPAPGKPNDGEINKKFDFLLDSLVRIMEKSFENNDNPNKGLLRKFDSLHTILKDEIQKQQDLSKSSITPTNGSGTTFLYKLTSTNTPCIINLGKRKDTSFTLNLNNPRLFAFHLDSIEVIPDANTINYGFNNKNIGTFIQSQETYPIKFSFKENFQNDSVKLIIKGSYLFRRMKIPMTIKKK